jgi:hemoglobin-like flavoprotein
MASRKELLRESFELVLEKDQDFPIRFYEILFERHPETRALFKSNSFRVQAKMLAQMLMGIVDHFDERDWLERELGALGAAHAGYGVTLEMYGLVGAALIDAIAEGCGPSFTSEHRVAWEEGYQLIAAFMQAGAKT